VRILIFLTVLTLVVVVPILAEDTATAPNSNLPIATGIFKPTDESLKQYWYPDWFRDAKFGIWAHWGPQAVPRQGDWYARKLYEHDAIDRRTGKQAGQSLDNKYHLAHYGHPSQFGYKDIIPLWKAEKGISPELWQTDTSIGDWYYRTGQKYKTSKEIVQMLIDIVSKNGNLLINIVQTPEGDLEPDMLRTLDEIGAWIAVNGGGIYVTRPWKVYGEGPSTKTAEKNRFGGLRDVPSKGYTPADFRFTTSKDGKALYAFCMGKPTSEIRITSLGGDKKLAEKPVTNVRLLGSEEKVEWKQEADALVIKVPAGETPLHTTVFCVGFEN